MKNYYIYIRLRIPTLSPVLLRSTAPLVYREASVTPAASVAIVVASIGIAARVPTLFPFSRLATAQYSNAEPDNQIDDRRRHYPTCYSYDI